jgi:ribosome biogenesis protein Tsr3
MNKLLLLLGLIAVDCGWDNHSMLVVEIQSEAKALPSANYSGGL